MTRAGWLALGGAILFCLVKLGATNPPTPTADEFSKFWKRKVSTWDFIIFGNGAIGDNCSVESPENATRALVQLREFMALSLEEFLKQYGNVSELYYVTRSFIDGAYTPCSLADEAVCVEEVCVACGSRNEDVAYAKTISEEAAKLKQMKKTQLTLTVEEVRELVGKAEDIFAGGVKEEGGRCNVTQLEQQDVAMEVWRLLSLTEDEYIERKPRNRKFLDAMRRMEEDGGKLCCMKSYLVCVENKCFNCRGTTGLPTCSAINGIPKEKFGGGWTTEKPVKGGGSSRRQWQCWAGLSCVAFVLPTFMGFCF